MADITMCTGGDCPLRDSCYRFLEDSDGENQTYFAAVPYSHDQAKCDFYWKVDSQVFPYKV